MLGAGCDVLVLRLSQCLVTFIAGHAFVIDPLNLFIVLALCPLGLHVQRLDYVGKQDLIQLYNLIQVRIAHGRIKRFPLLW